MSAKINIENYELYAIDYIEGTLSAEARVAFEAFLASYPDIKLEIEEMSEGLILETQASLSKQEKDQLKVAITPVEGVTADNFEERFAEAVDIDLHPEALNTAKAFVKHNPSFEKDLDLYAKTKLQADSTITFREKSRLKRTVPLWENASNYAYRMAAILVVALGGLTVFNFLNEEVYQSRSTIESFSGLEVEEPAREISVKNPVMAETEDAPQSITYLAMASRPEKREKLLIMPTLATTLINEPDGVKLEQRTLDAYAAGDIPNYFDIQEEMAMASNTSNAFTLPQFIAHKVLGIKPKSEEPKEILKEGIETLIDNSEMMAYTKATEKDKKATFQLLAGNFEVKRVTFK